ncbi:hypothetical protein GCM10022243_47790 [Saccharothrix violaceirubra]
MGLDFDDTLTRASRRYARSATAALGLSGDCWCVQGERPAGLYLALEGRWGSFPDYDVALLWNEHRGWSAVVETGDGADLVVDRLDGPVVPRSASVAKWIDEIFRRSAAGDPVDDELPRVVGGGPAAVRDLENPTAPRAASRVVGAPRSAGASRGLSRAPRWSGIG